MSPPNGQEPEQSIASVDGAFTITTQLRTQDNTHSFVSEGERDFQVPGDATSLRFTLRWRDAAGQAGPVQLTLGDGSGILARASGTSPLTIDLVGDALRPGAIHIMVDPPGPAGAAPPREFTWLAELTLRTP